MKLVAHPLVVAVALGFVGPGALSSLDASPERRPTPCTDCEEGESVLPVSDVALGDAEEVELRNLLDEALSLLG